MNDSSGGMFDVGMSSMRVWSDYVSKMAQAATSLSPQSPPTESAREMRSAALDEWARMWDQFLRSPQFLTMMQQSLAGSVQWRKQWNDWLGEVQHQFQGASRQDVDQLMLGLRHLEQRMVDVTEKLNARLDELTERLDAGQYGDEEVELNGHSGDVPLKSNRKQAGRAGKKKEPADVTEL